MFLYRISSSEYIHDLSGFGASLHNNRWNSKGTYMIYTSTHRSLALLEVLVHLPPHLIRTVDLSILTLEIQEAFIAENKQMVSSVQESRKLGDKWVNSNFSVGLAVTSVIIPQELNILLNPKQPEFSKQIKKVQVEKLNIDERLFQF